MQQWLSLGWSGLQLDAREKTRKGSCAVVTNMECWTWKWRRQKSTRKPHGTQKLESDIQWVGRAVAFGRSRFPGVSWKSWTNLPDPQLVPEAWWVTLPHRGLYLHSHVIASDGRCTPFGEFSHRVIVTGGSVCFLVVELLRFKHLTEFLLFTSGRFNFLFLELYTLLYLQFNFFTSLYLIILPLCNWLSSLYRILFFPFG